MVKANKLVPSAAKVSFILSFKSDIQDSCEHQCFERQWKQSIRFRCMSRLELNEPRFLKVLVLLWRWDGTLQWSWVGRRSHPLMIVAIYHLLFKTCPNFLHILESISHAITSTHFTCKIYYFLEIRLSWASHFKRILNFLLFLRKNIFWT